LSFFEGNFRNRTCVHVSNDGVYRVEERERLAPSKVLKGDIDKFNIPSETVQVIMGKKRFL